MQPDPSLRNQNSFAEDPIPHFQTLEKRGAGQHVGVIPLLRCDTVQITLQAQAQEHNSELIPEQLFTI